jgi:hypothetical protein
VNAKSLRAGLAGALVIAFVAGQAVAQEADCSKVDAEANVKALGIAYYPPGAKTVGNFVPGVTVGKVMYLAGNGRRCPTGSLSSASWAQGLDS